MGYAGGAKVSPTYRDLGDHTEAIEVDYDPGRTSYERLLAVFWEDNRPLRAAYKRQYRSAIFFLGAEQQALAEASKRAVEASAGQRVFVDLEPLARFWRAEDYHQKYALRRHSELLDELAGYDARMFTDSTAAARLNAYAYGYGTPADLAAELLSLGLSPRGARYLERLVRQRAGDDIACGAR